MRDAAQAAGARTRTCRFARFGEPPRRDLPVRAARGRRGGGDPRLDRSALARERRHAASLAHAADARRGFGRARPRLTADFRTADRRHGSRQRARADARRGSRDREDAARIRFDGGAGLVVGDVGHLQGAPFVRRTRGVLRRPAGRSVRVALRALSPTLFDQHLAFMAARSTVSAHRAQRRDQHDHGQSRLARGARHQDATRFVRFARLQRRDRRDVRCGIPRRRSRRPAARAGDRTRRPAAARVLRRARADRRTVGRAGGDRLRRRRHDRRGAGPHRFAAAALVPHRLEPSLGRVRSGHRRLQGRSGRPPRPPGPRWPLDRSFRVGRGRRNRAISCRAPRARRLP